MIFSIVLQWRSGHRTLQEAQWAIQRTSYCKVSGNTHVCVSVEVSTLEKVVLHLTLHVCLSTPHSYMSIVESLPTYGVHYYAVKVQFYYPALCFLTHTHTKTFSVLVHPLWHFKIQLYFVLYFSLSISLSRTTFSLICLWFNVSGQAGDPVVVGSEL